MKNLVHYILASWAATLLLGVSPAAADCQPGKGIDTTIGVFDYVGNPQDFKYFRSVVAERFNQMVYEFNAIPGQPNIGGLKLSDSLGAVELSVADLATYSSQN